MSEVQPAGWGLSDQADTIAGKSAVGELPGSIWVGVLASGVFRERS